jgi:hypothetical protein
MSEFGHYFKDVSGLQKIDVYRVVELFEVPAGALDHAAKKILCAGFRGVKDQLKDVREAHKSLGRWLEMRDEDERAATIRKAVESGDIVLEFGEPAIDQLDGYHRTITLDVPMGLTAGRTVEPAAEIDESRADRVASSHGDGEHYAYVCGVCQ